MPPTKQSKGVVKMGRFTGKRNGNMGFRLLRCDATRNDKAGSHAEAQRRRIEKKDFQPRKTRTTRKNIFQIASPLCGSQ